MVGTQQVQEINDMQGNNNKDKAIIRLKAEMHLNLTLKLLAPIYYVKVTRWDYSLIWIKVLQIMIHKGHKGSRKFPQRLDHDHTIPSQTI
jgi:hypothetical protein